MEVFASVESPIILSIKVPIALILKLIIETNKERKYATLAGTNRVSRGI